MPVREVCTQSLTIRKHRERSGDSSFCMHMCNLETYIKFYFKIPILAE